MEMAAAVRKCATFIEKKIGKHIDVTTMAYNRLMNHIRHMVSRAATGEKLKVDLNQFIEKIIRSHSHWQVRYVRSLERT